jgi:hypothetical protein
MTDELHPMEKLVYLEAEVADQQSKLADLHAAFSARLDAVAAAHKTECAQRETDLRVREKCAAEKLQIAIDLDAALKAKAAELERRERAHNDQQGAVRARFAALEREMDEDAAARANPQRIGS